MQMEDGVHGGDDGPLARQPARGQNPRPTTLGPTLPGAVGEYVSKVRASQREATWRNAQAHLRPWSVRLGARGAHYTSQITTDLLLNDLIWLRETPSQRTGRIRTDSSVKTTATAIRSFLSWSYDKKYVDRRLLDDFEIPKGRKASVYNPQSHDISGLFGIIEDYWDPSLRPEIAHWDASLLRWYPTRFCALILVQMTTALRIGETCHLGMTDWNKERQVLVARHTKSGDERDVPVDAVVAEALEEWLRVRPKKSPTDYLFCTEIGTKMDPRTVSQTLRRYLIWGRAHGYDLPRITLHSLRHYALTKVAMVGLSQAQQLAGHADPKTTRLYVHTTTDAVREAVARAGLLDGVIVSKRAAKKSKGGKPRGKRLIS